MPDSYIAYFFFSISCVCFGVCDSVLHFVFGFWVSFCLIFWDIRLSGLVGDSILGLFVFPFGDSVFLFGIFISQSRLTLGYHFPFCLCVFLCGVSGLCFRVLFFVFYPFGHHIYVVWGKHVIELSRNTTWRGHVVYICQISCFNAIIQYFFSY